MLEFRERKALEAHPDHLSLRLLGAVGITVNGSAAEGVLRRKVIALLAYLATEQRPHHRDQLVTMFWPDMQPEAARGNLRGALYRLRRFIGEGNLEITRTTVALKGCRVDVNDFMAPLPDQVGSEVIESALALYGGTFLDGIALINCPDFDDWLHSRRETYHRRALSLMERLCDRYEQAGEPLRAMELIRAYLAIEPWNENVFRRLIQLLALNGSRHEVKAQFELFRRELQQGFGVEPSAETVALVQKISSGSTTARPRQPDAVPTPDGHRAPTAIERGERRQVTVLYCSIRASDPERQRPQVIALRQRCFDTIGRFDGHYSQPHGSAILAYFGYPAASEHAALNAVRAALAVTALGDDTAGIYAGLHTGLTVATDQLPDEMGTISSIAQQLSQAARPDQAVILSETTHLLVEGFFRSTPSGRLAPGESARPLATFSVTGESGARIRLDTQERLTPFIGRGREIEQLYKAWLHVGATRSRLCVLVSGEPGIGKSRMLQAFIKQVSEDGGIVRVLRGLPQHSQSPYRLLADLIESECGLSADDSQEERTAKLEAWIRRSPARDDRQAADLLGELFGTPRAESSETSAEQQKQRLREYLLHLLQPQRQDAPQLLVIEDLHWADPSTLEILKKYVEMEAGAAQLVVMSARPNFVPPWDAHYASELRLAPLVPGDIRAITVSVNPELDDQSVDSIVARADGIPLFAEEMAKLAAFSDAGIPSTLQDLLAARLDQVGGARQTALLAAAIGREFDAELLAAASEFSRDGVMLHLDALRANGLIQAISPSRQQFKHALIQEAVYQSQTHADREATHRRVADAILEHFPQIVSGQPELLAHHLTEAGHTYEAVEYWIAAGKQAVRQSANLEARDHFNKALELLAGLPRDEQRDRTEFTILGLLCPVLYAVTGYGSEEATAANARLEALGGVSNSLELFLPKWAQVMNTICNARGKKLEALDTALELPAMVQGDPVKEVAAQYAVGMAHYWLGRFEEVRIHCENAMKHYRTNLHARLIEHFGDDLYVDAAAFSAAAHYFLGFPARAQAISVEMLAYAESRNYPHTLAVALSWQAFLYRWLDLPHETLALSSRVIELSEKNDFTVWLAVGQSMSGWARVMLGDAAGLDSLHSGVARMRQYLFGVPVSYTSPLISAYIHLKQFDAALALANECLADSTTTGECFFDAELYRLKGECLLAMADREGARACFLEALKISRAQKALSLQLRAAISLAHHFGEAEPLSMLYRLFDTSVETPDLQRAHCLLQELKPPLDLASATEPMDRSKRAHGRVSIKKR